MMTPPRIAIFALLLLLCPLARGEDRKKEPARRVAGDVELAILDETKLARVRLAVTIDGKDAGVVWQEAITALFAHLDRDDDGSLSPAEAARLPRPFDLRRMLWASFLPSAGVGGGWKDADVDRDGKLSRDEVARFYAQHGVGITVGTGKSPHVERMNKAMMVALDADRDGRVSLKEMRAAETALMKLDRNEDELISPDELVKGTRYPGATGGERLSPGAIYLGGGLLLLPDEGGDWAKALHSHLAGKKGKLDLAASRLSKQSFAALDADKDGELSAAELVRWRERPPELSLRASFAQGKATLTRLAGESEACGAGLSCRLGGASRLHFRADAGTLPVQYEKVRVSTLERFAAADADRHGYLTAKDASLTREGNLRQLIEPADRNGDGKMTRDELRAFLAVQEKLTRAAVLVTLIDQGRGLFEAMDADGDGVLSARELRTAAARLEAAGCFTDSVLVPTRLPRFWRVTASLGQATAPVGVVTRGGPDWFRAMDRNGDGDVSRREFTGTAEQFDKLDLDRDGFISPEEAEKAGKKTR